ncbi:MAG: FAD:protein FMN transferase [Planctomycetota bacterium]|jgi:thiamine biosynthesis lipoprotein
MGTTYNVKYIESPDAGQCPDNTKLRNHIQACLDDINQKMSTYIPESELSRFNAHSPNTPFAVSKETVEVFQLAQRISEMTNGAFDITVGPIVNAYGFGPQPRQAMLPTDDQLTALRKTVGFDRVTVDPQAGTLTKSGQDVYCDLSAIAKGYAVDKVAEWLNALRCIQSYMVEIGGETRVKGRNAHNKPWRIGIEKPSEKSRTIHRAIELTDRAIATSGDYRNFYTHNGKRISHTIDPRTGRPVNHNLASVSVIHQRCAEADAWATALMVLGPDEGYKLAEKYRIAAMFLVRQENQKITEKTTTAFTQCQAAKT